MKPSAKSTLEDHGDDGRSPQLDALPGIPFRVVCGKCGASRTDNQVGLEATPDEYVARMVDVFREVRRVLRRDGTLWLNLGDSYANDTKWGGSTGGKHVSSLHGNSGIGRQKTTTGLKAKDLCMIPARVALALQADGWYLRSEITWCKPNPMPESVTDRPTQATEKVFLFSRSPRYFYDAEAVREPAEWQRWGDQTNGKHEGSGSRAGWIGNKTKAELQRGPTWEERKAAGATSGGVSFGQNPVHGEGLSHDLGDPSRGRNLRNWWEIATEPYPDAHFATYPQELVRRCILAGTSERGCCPECGAAWVREVEREADSQRPGGINRHHRDDVSRGTLSEVARYATSTTGWRPSCDCVTDPLGDPTIFRAPVPCTVLDPFFGSGTTGLVARKHGRRTIGIELSPEYCGLAARRLSQLSLLAEPAC